MTPACPLLISTWEDIHDEQDRLAEAIALCKQRLAADMLSKPRNPVGANRLELQGMTRLQAIYSATAQSHSATMSYCAKVGVSALPLSEPQVADFSQMPVRAPVYGRQGELHAWIRTVANHRDSFAGTALLVVDAHSRDVVQCYLVVVALQQPMSVVLQQATHVSSPDLTAEMLDDAAAVGRHRQVLHCMPGAGISESHVALDPAQQEIFVVTQLVAGHGFWMYSDEECIPWLRFVHDFPVAPVAAGRQPRERAAPGTAPLPAWAQKWLHKSETQVASSSAGVAASRGGGASSSSGLAEVRPLSKEQEEEVDAQLAAVRAWLATQLPIDCENFSCRVLGGRCW